ACGHDLNRLWLENVGRRSKSADMRGRGAATDVVVPDFAGAQSGLRPMKIFARRTPMFPRAPGRFSMRIGCPSRSDSHWPMRRATMWALARALGERLMTRDHEAIERVRSQYQNENSVVEN